MRAATNRRHGARRTALNYTALHLAAPGLAARSRAVPAAELAPGTSGRHRLHAHEDERDGQHNQHRDENGYSYFSLLGEPPRGPGGRSAFCLSAAPSLRRIPACRRSGFRRARPPRRAGTAGRSATSRSAAQGTGIFALTGSEGQAGRTGIAGSFPPADRCSVSDGRFLDAPRRRVASCRLEPSSSSSRQWRYQPTKQPS